MRNEINDNNEKYKLIKGHQQELKESYDKHKEKLRELKDKAKLCELGSEECKERKQELKRGVKLHLLKTGDVIARSLEKLTNRVEAAAKLSDEEKETALDAIAELETKLAAAQEKLENQAEEMSNEELKESIQELKQVWQDVRNEQRRLVASLISSKQEALVEKLGKFAETMEEKTSKLESVDTNELERLQTEYSALLENLKEKQAEVEDKIAAGEEIKEAQDEFKSNLKEIKDTLRDFTSTYKELSKTNKEEISKENSQTTEEE